ncbi:hypothetical protein KKI23_00275 [Patescibacteria group bacterium]|nr:hypothetical protein [Patescibacteria group bacterium]
MADSLSLKAIQAAYQQTGRGGLEVLADCLDVKEMVLAREIARVINQEEDRCRSEKRKIGDYRVVLRRVFLKSGPRTERIRQDLIELGLIQVPDHAERGHQGGLAKHRVKLGYKPDPAAKKSAVPKMTTEEKLLQRMRVIPKSGTLIDHVEMQQMSIAEIREFYQLDNDDEGWRLLLAYRGLTHHPLFEESVSS